MRRASRRSRALRSRQSMPSISLSRFSFSFCSPAASAHATRQSVVEVTRERSGGSEGGMEEGERGREEGKE
eukprot:3178594-Rhodomonas_salina.1